MTERTFRTPSPGRPASSGGPELAPPVPKLPQDIPPVPKVKDRTSKRATSLDTHGNRQPPATPVSPALAAAAKSTGTSTPPILQRQDSRNSINFSYPRPQSPPPQSPSSPPSGAQSTLRNGISATEANRVQYDITAAAQAPVKKKKKKVAPGASEGSHLQSGSMGAKPIVTPLEPGPEIPSGTTADRPVKKKKKVALTGENSHFPQTDSDGADSDTSPEQKRRSQRAAGVLMKQPSVVREDWEGEQEEVCENAEAQQREEQSLSPVASTTSNVQSKKTTAANMSRKIEEPSSPTVKAMKPEIYNLGTQQTLDQANTHLAVADQAPARQSSTSPSRSTRFSDNLSSDMGTGKKHEPLPRSISPVKSALKHHSANEDHIRRGISPGEASDSNMSADGSVRRKKSARVSFEPEAEVVGVAAPSQSSDSPVVASPQNKDGPKKGGFFSLGRSKPPLTSIPSEDDLDEHMKPRPQLPSFGSIRKQNRRAESSESAETTPRSTPEKLLLSPATQVSATSSDSSLSTTSPPQEKGASSDHAVGAILAQHAEQSTVKKDAPRDPNLPLPPIVTSVEGGGYMSDSASNYSVDSESATEDRPDVSQLTGSASVASKTVPEASVLRESENEKATEKTLDNDVPQVAVQPPTPGIEEDRPTDQWLVDVPGGFPGIAEDLVSATPPKKTFGPSAAELAREAELAKLRAPVEEAGEEEDEEEPSDNDSIYSDAAEEPEGDGFGSINAIVESPMIESPAKRSPPQSPLAGKSVERPTDNHRSTSWEDTQQHWSGLAKQSRQGQATPPQQASQQLQQVTASQPAAAPPVARAARVTSSTPTAAPSAPAPKPKKKKTTGTAAIGAAVAAVPASQRPQAVQAPPPHTMKMSMRQGGSKSDARAGPNTMRTSMRQQGDAPNPRSLQASKWAPPAEPARPKSPPQAAVAAPARAALQKKHIPPATTAPAPKVAPRAAVPVVADDSDSDSSFQRARKNKRSNDGSYNMRRSMRAPVQAPPPSGGRGTVRSLSPPVRRPFSPAGAERSMRTSMRGSMDAGAPTLRQPPQQKRSSSLFGRRKAKSPERAAPLPLTAKIRSKLDDSDDEDGPRPTTFRSRFADSSDDEADAAPLRPVRGIPKRRDDGDSTDLDDSSDEEKKRPKRQLQPAIKIDTKAAQNAAPATDVPLSPNTMKKRGLFSRFRSKNKKEDSPTPQKIGVPSISSTIALPASKEEGETPFDENMGFGSSAERDAMIQQTMAKLEAAKSADPSTPPAKVEPASVQQIARPQSPSGKLQRRRPERVMSDSWPLPPSPATPATVDRPSTADPASVGVKANGVTTLRPPNERRPTSETFTDVGSPTSTTKAQKKRFGMLRKAFGLKD